MTISQHFAMKADEGAVWCVCHKLCDLMVDFDRLTTRFRQFGGLYGNMSVWGCCGRVSVP